MKHLLMLVLAFVASSTLTFAQLGDSDGDEPDTTGDARVRAALDQLQLQYTVVSGGKFKMVFELEEGRTQVVLINSQTETTGKFEIREIWSPGYRSDGPLPRDVANRLLISSFEQKLGAWQTMEGESSHTAVFAIKLAANADAASLRGAILICVNTADTIEKELTNADEF